MDNRCGADGKEELEKRGIDMAVMVLDPYVEERILAEREGSDGSQYDEVWEGVYVDDAAAEQ